MEKLNVRTILREAWRSTQSNFFAWAAGFLAVFLPITILQYMASFAIGAISGVSYTISWEGISDIYALDRGFSVLFVAFGLLYYHKFSLTLTRNPQMVRRHLGQAIAYSITDGFLRRFAYSLIVVLPPIIFQIIVWVFGKDYLAALLLQFFQNAGEILALLPLVILTWPFFYLVIYSVNLLLIESHFFLLSYIIQDTGSADNLRKPLSFWTCLVKSFSLIWGYRIRYWLINFIPTMIATFLLYVASLVIVYIPGAVFLSFLITPLVSVATGILFIFRFSARTILANALMERDPEIVDFGD